MTLKMHPEKREPEIPDFYFGRYKFNGLKPIETLNKGKEASSFTTKNIFDVFFFNKDSLFIGKVRITERKSRQNPQVLLLDTTSVEAFGQVSNIESLKSNIEFLHNIIVKS